MGLLLYCLSQAVSTLLGILSLSILLRSLFSFIPGAEDWTLTAAVYYISETVVSPVRALLCKITRSDEDLLGLAPIATYAIILTVQLLLPQVVLALPKGPLT